MEAQTTCDLLDTLRNIFLVGPDDLVCPAQVQAALASAVFIVSLQESARMRPPRLDSP